jgi:exosortase
MMEANTYSAKAFSFTPFTAFIAFCVAMLALYLDSLKPLMRQWAQSDESLGHAPLLFLVICGWLWTCRHRFNQLAHAPPWAGAALVGVASMAWLLVSMGDIELLEQLLLVPMILSLAVLTAGWRAMLTLVVPVSMMLFCLPLFDGINDQLVDLSSWAVGGMLQLTPVTSFMSGNAIALPAGSVVIADGCSGLRYLVIGLATANLAASMNRLRLVDHFLLNLIAAAAMIAVNWIRIFSIVIVAYVTDMQSPLVSDHESFGWVLFGIGLLPVVLYARRRVSMDT